MPKRRKHLVVQHLEKIHYKVFESFPSVLTEFIKYKNGIYALYKRDRLYYVGLATNLKSRVGQHLKDRHQDRWDHFSLFVTETDEPLRELEALVLRIAKPTGNKATTRLTGSENLRTEFGRAIRQRQKKDREILIGKSGYSKAKAEKNKNAKKDGKARGAAGLVKVATPIRMTYKGEKYRASLRPDGTIRFKGEVYNSPTGAAQAVRHTTSGWHWWHIRRKGKWVRLKEFKA